jgi:hypothetical protein
VRGRRIGCATRAEERGRRRAVWDMVERTIDAATEESRDGGKMRFGDEMASAGSPHLISGYISAFLMKLEALGSRR